MPAPLHITLIQPDIIWEDKAANMQQYEEYFKKLPQQRHIVLLPEMCTTGFSMEPEKLAEDMNGPSVQWLRDMSKQYRCIIAGSFIIEEEGKYYNRLIWMQPNGQHYQYDKRHLFGYAGEHEHYTPGDQRLIVQVNGWRICPLVCYDLRFPVWGRNSLSDYPNGPQPYLPPTGEGAGGDISKISPHLGPPPTGEEAKGDELAEGEFFQSADAQSYHRLKEFVAVHRSSPTNAETILWKHLRNEQLDNYSFRRQHIVGKYIADFICLAKKLIIDVDGHIHQLPDNLENDQQRTAWLETEGYTVIRFTNNEVESNTDVVLQRIVKTLQNLPFAQRKIYSQSSQPGPFPCWGKAGLGANDTKEPQSGPLPPLGEGSGLGAKPEDIKPVTPTYDILLYLANWPQRRSLAWKTLLQARAIENQCYTIGLNRVGKDGKDIEYSGDSSVFGPLGETLWQQTGDAVMHTVTLSKEELDNTRQQFPFLHDADPFVLL